MNMKLSERVSKNLPGVVNSPDWEAFADLLDTASAIPHPISACRHLEAAMLLADDATATAGMVDDMPYGLGFLYLYRLHGEDFAIKLDVDFDGGYQRLKGHGVKPGSWEKVTAGREERNGFMTSRWSAWN